MQSFWSQTTSLSSGTTLEIEDSMRRFERSKRFQAELREYLGILVLARCVQADVAIAYRIVSSAALQLPFFCFFWGGNLLRRRILQYTSPISVLV